MTTLFDALLDLEGAASLGRLRVLVDIRGLHSMDASARSVVYRRMQESRRRAFAVVGRSTLHRMLFNFLTFATRQPSARFFDDLDEARAWLLSLAPRHAPTLLAAGVGRNRGESL